MNTLIIAEKLSVADSLARFLKLEKSKGGFFQGNNYIVSWASGHLLELYNPDDYDRKLKRWSWKTLPIIPEVFKIKSKDHKQLEILLKLIKKRDVKQLVNACDPGREGELIFRYIYEYSQSQTPVKRLWLNALTQESISESLKNLINQESLDPLFIAAKSRAEADWLVGINGSRSFTLKHKLLLPVGRVQTPTLAIITKRDREIESFIPHTFYELFADFSADKGSYQGKWQGSEGDRSFDKKMMEEINVRIKNKNGTIKTFKETEEKIIAPLLFDLGALQKEANQRFGFSASRTLKIAQILYESKKLITYPRTDSKYLPTSYVKEIPAILKALMNSVYYSYTGPLKKTPTPKFRIFNDTRVTDHHAIVPTSTEPVLTTLSKDEVKVYDAIVKRFLAAFYEPDLYRKVYIETLVEKELFITSEKIMVKPGWSVVYDRVPGETRIAFKLNKGDPAKVINSHIEEGVTQPPPHYNDGTLISILETAGKLIDDEELKEALKDKGLGTPATRAQIIDKLVLYRYIEREANLIKITPKGKEFVEVIEKENPDLISPDLTAEWEFRLKMIEKEKETRDAFMKDIKEFVINMVESIKASETSSSLMVTRRVTLGTSCPLCGKNIKENRLAYACEGYKEGCKMTIWKKSFGRIISFKEAEKLLENKKIGPLWFTSRAGKKYLASLVITENGVTLEFQNNLPVKKSYRKSDQSDKQTDYPDVKKSVKKEVFVENNYHDVGSGVQKPEVVPEKNLVKKRKSPLKKTVNQETQKKKNNKTKNTTKRKKIIP